jgi:DNA-binding NarL/FixJ family response regulator
MAFKKRVILIDEDENFLMLLNYTLGQNENVRVVSQYTTCAAALKGIHHDKPDLVIMEIDFIEMKGIEFIASVRKEYHGLEFLIVTQSMNRNSVLRVLSTGARGFLLKRDALNRVNSAANLVLQGAAPLDEYAARFLVDSIQSDSNSPLSRQETNVMKLMMQGMTYTRIAKELGISKETAKVHMRNIYKKLNVNSKAEAVSKAVSEKIISASMIY